jgi:hypothetical protein
MHGTSVILGGRLPRMSERQLIQKIASKLEELTGCEPPSNHLGPLGKADGLFAVMTHCGLSYHLAGLTVRR